MDLPQPINGTEAYLKAINDNLIAIREQMEKPDTPFVKVGTKVYELDQTFVDICRQAQNQPAPEGDVVELQEPAKTGRKGRAQ